jgi:hypothetical protein
MRESLDDPSPPLAKQPVASRKGSYGIEAPKMLPILGVLFAANVASGVVSGTAWPFVGAAAVLACAGCGLHTSRRVKFEIWTELLDHLRLRGDERVLDLGCNACRAGRRPGRLVGTLKGQSAGLGDLAPPGAQENPATIRESGLIREPLDG